MVDEKTYTTADFETEIIQESGSLTINASVIDKRGRNGSVSVSENVLSYNAPNIGLLKVQRCDLNGTLNDQGEYVKVTINASVSPLNNVNTATYKLEYKRTSDAEFNDVVLNAILNNYSVFDYSVIFPADSGSSYEVKLSVTDDFGMISKKTVVSTGFTTFNVNASGKGFSLGKVSEKDAFEVEMDSYFLKDVYFKVGDQYKTIFEIIESCISQ